MKPQAAIPPANTSAAFRISARAAPETIMPVAEAWIVPALDIVDSDEAPTLSSTISSLAVTVPVLDSEPVPPRTDIPALAAGISPALVTMPSRPSRRMPSLTQAAAVPSSSTRLSPAGSSETMAKLKPPECTMPDSPMTTDWRPSRSIATGSMPEASAFIVTWPSCPLKMARPFVPSAIT